MKRQIDVDRLLDRFCGFLMTPYKILLLIIIICCTPIIFTRTAFCKNLIFTETGQIGDTLGGITAPFIGIFNIILLILTLLAQYRFNKNQANDNTVSQLLNLQNEIIHLNDRITFSYTNEKGAKSKGNGVESLSLLQWGNDGQPKITLREMNYLLGQIKPVIRLCNHYASLVGKMKQEDEEFSSFSVHYKDLIKNFLDNIDKVSLDASPGDPYSEDDCPSEIDAMKDNAKKLRELLR